MAEYIERDWLYEQMNATDSEFSLINALEMIENFPAADVAPVVRCRECKHSAAPSKLIKIYGQEGTLTCQYGPCNGRNINEADFCSYGKRREG